MTQGLITVLRGGDFKTGFISAIASKLSGAMIAGMGLQGANPIGEATIAALFGGMASAASGGDFAEGALTAMVVYLYNEVSAVLDTKEEKLYMADNDTGEHVVVDAFTGGKVDAHGRVAVTDGGVRQKAAPSGKYLITDNVNPQKHPGWFSLLYNDGRIDDYHNGRSGIRLYNGALSFGCVTIKNNLKQWQAVRSLLLNTKTKQIKFYQGPHWYNWQNSITYYGTLEIK